MGSKALCLCLCLSLCISYVLSGGDHITSTNRQQLLEQTTVPAAALARRDDVPTLTFGPATNYVNQPSNAPTIASSGISLVERSEATGGVDLFLGPDKQEKVQSIINASCPNNPNSQCIQDMAEAFDYKEVGIQARQAVVVVVSVLVLAFAYWIQHTLDDNPQKADHIFIPETDISRAASAASSSTLVFVTAAQDPSPVTVMSATDTTDPNTSGLVVSTATANGDGYGKGDVVIQVPEDLGGRLHNVIGLGSQCASQQIGQTSLDCVEEVSEFVMLQSQQNAPLRDLVLLTTTLPDLKGDLATHVANVIQYASKKLTSLSLSDDGLKFLAEVAFWVVYEQLVEQIQVPDQIVIPAASTVSAATAASSSSSCPPEDRKPNCSNCGGTQTNEKKTSGVCPSGRWKGCPCVDGPTYPNNFLNSTTLAKYQAILANLPTKFRSADDEKAICAGPEKTDIFSFKVKVDMVFFCEYYHMMEVGNGTLHESYDNGDGNWINIWASQDQVTCGNPHQKFDIQACESAMNKAINDCAKGTTTKGGTVGHYQCMNFGFYGSDAATANRSVTCPDPNPLLNFALNPCDTKCNNAGWEHCEPDIEGTNVMENPPSSKIKYDAFIKWGCFCKNTQALTSPCAGMKCGDPIKMRNGPLKDGKPRYGEPYRDSAGKVQYNQLVPPSLLACDVMCTNGHYDCAAAKGRKFAGHNACRCTDQPSQNLVCVDAIRDYGIAGR